MSCEDDFIIQNNTDKYELVLSTSVIYEFVNNTLEFSDPVGFSGTKNNTRTFILDIC